MRYKQNNMCARYNYIKPISIEHNDIFIRKKYFSINFSSGKFRLRYIYLFGETNSTGL